MFERYRATFQIDADRPSVRETIRCAVAERFDGPTPDADTGRWTGNHQTLEIDEADQDDFWMLQLQWTINTDLDDGNRGYLVDLSVAQTDGPIEFLAAISSDDPSLPEPRRLDVVCRLIEQFDCSCASLPLRTAAEEIRVDEAVSFADEVLLSPERQLPIVALSRDRDGYTAHPPDAIQRDLAGRALVTVWDGDVSTVISDRIGRQFACYGGAIRIYRPGAKEQDGAGHHQFFLLSQTRNRGFRSQLSRRINALAPQSKAAERMAEIEERIRRAKSDALSRQVSELSRALERQQNLTEQQLAAIQETHQAQEQRICELEDENARLRELQVGRELALESPVELEASFAEEVDLRPDTVVEALQIAETQCSNLHFFGSAQRSAEESHYAQPERVLAGLRALERVAVELRERTLSEHAILQTLNERGHEASTESVDTMRRYGDQRQFRDYDGRLVEMQPHIKLGGGAGADSRVRIHFAWDEESAAIVVGYVGRHLRTGRS